MGVLGFRPLAPVLSAVGVATDLVAGAAGRLTGGGRGHRSREVWSRPGRLHIETHGVHGAGGAQVARRVEQVLEAHPRVRWARVNAPACRVVVEVDEPPPRRRDLVAMVAAAEATPASPEEDVAEQELHHPAESPQETGLPQNLAVDAVALVLAGVNRVAPWAPFPAELAGLVSAAELHPRLRELAAERLHGQERADSTLSTVARLGHALAAGGSGAVLDIAQRVGQWREARAGQEAWRRAEPELVRGPDHAGAEPVAAPRPTRRPEGPVERYQQRVLAGGLAAAALAVPVVGVRRAAAIGLASLPKATAAGPTAFASHLGRVLSRSGALVMDRAVLRRLGGLDTLLLDGAALHSTRWTLTELVPLAGADTGMVAEQGFALFDPADPVALRRGDGWLLGPIDQLELTGRRGVREQRRLAERGAGVVLGLARGKRLQAVLSADTETVPGLDGLVAAARRAGMRIVLATDASQPGGRNSFADALVPRGRSVLGQVRQLQAGGRTVMLLSSERRALGAADCGIGIHVDGSPPPWGAHVIVGSELANAVLLVEAVTAAGRVERDSILLAQASSGIGAAGAVANRRPRPAAGSLAAVNTGAALAFADGAWRAHQLHTGGSGGPVSTRPPWHMMPPAAVLRHLGSDESGLPDAEARRRWRPGDRLEPLGTSLGTAFLEELANPLTPILAGGAALSAVVGSLVDAGLVTAVAGLSGLTGAAQRVRTDRALADLLARSAVGATVRRGGEAQVVTAEQLVIGDVIQLGSGDVVPADCRLLEASGVEVDESSLTGESLPVTKDPAPVVAAELAGRSSMLYEGTTLSTGRARAVVVATGAETEVGRSLAAAGRRSAPVTGVQAHLGRLTRRSLPVALGSAAAVTGAGLLHGVSPRESLGAAANLAVASVPEGLPFLVNAAQLSAARRLADRGALVRNPRTIEALGRVDVLCFDKTGTLTEGRLSVHEVHDGQRSRSVGSLGAPGRAVVAAALRASPDGQRPQDFDHQTDRAVVDCAQRARVRTGTGARGWRQQVVLPFEPSRGFHATVGQAGKQAVLSVKGAPEVVLPRCDRRLVEGQQRPLDDPARDELTGVAERLAGAGNRVLAVAERREPAAGEAPEPDPDAVAELVFLGFLAFADPVRASAAPAAAQLRDAGVQIVMVTGDHPATAESIASTLHPEQASMEVVTGAELAELDDAELQQRLLSVDVIARCSPAQKVRIIQAYQRAGKVVAMTGDGANDAPAIRLAEVGIALGRRGTAAAQAAADLVVSDDRLETIIAALVEGRAMWSSVRHALAILLGGNLGEITFTVLGAALTGRSPLAPRQLLLVNLLTDLAPAMAIALRGPDRADVPQLLREGPDVSLGGALNRELAVRALATTAGAGSAWIGARLTGRSRRASTVALAALVGTQLGQTLVTGGLDRNVLLASLGSAGVLAGVIQTPGVSHFFGCTPLGPVGWGLAAGGATAGTCLGAALSIGRKVAG